jgi:PAS domain S-box-containing protein
MTPYTILYVDDEPELLNLGKIYLEMQGDFIVDTCLSVKECLDAGDLIRYDAIVSDYQMPDMDGLAFLKLVRSDFGSLPFILFTGKGREEVVIEAINSGVDFYLQKGGAPKAQFAELAHKIKMAVERKRAVDERIESEKRLSTIFHASPIHQMITEYESGRIIDINDRFLHDLRLPRSEVIGKTQQEIGLLIDPEQMEAIYRQLEKTGIVRNVPIIIHNRAGKVFTSLTSLTRVHVHDKDLVYTHSVDISEQAKARQTITALINAPPEVSLLLDTNGIILAVNHAATIRYALSEKELVGRSAYTLIDPGLADLRQQMIGQAISSKKPLIFTDDRTERTYENHLYPVLDADGNVTAVAVYSTDVTEDIRAKQALKESEEKYRLLVEHSHDGVYIYRDNTFLFINQQAALITGYSHDELMEMNIWDTIHPDDRTRLQKSAAQRLSGEQVSSAFYARFLKRDGSVREGEFFVDLVNFQGKPSIFGIFRDITEKKRAEEELREHAAQLRSLSNNLPRGMVYQLIIEPDGKRRFAFVSAGVERIFERKAEDVIREPFLLYNQVPTGERAALLQAETDALASMSLFTYETRIRTPSGAERWIHIRSAPRSLPSGSTIWDGITLDVTAEKQAELELKAAYEQITSSEEELRSQYEELKQSQMRIAESEEKYRALVDHSQDGVFIAQDEKLVFINSAYATMAGYMVEELLGKPFGILVSPEDREMVLSRYRERMAGNSLIEAYEFFVLHKDQKTRIRVKINVGRGMYNGRPAAIGTLRNVDEERRHEEALRESEEKYRMIIETMQDVFYRIDKNGTITMISPYGARIVGYGSPEEMIGKLNASDFYADLKEQETLITMLLKEKAVTGYPLTLKDRSGNLHYATANSHIRYDAAGNFDGIEGILHDITDLRRTEQALRQANRQITLVTSITHHDIRNQLAALSGYLELSRQQVNSPEKMLEIIEKEQQIADVIEQQIRFSHDFEDMGVKKPLWQPLAPLVTMVADNMAAEEKPDIRVDLPDVEVFADPLLPKVFYNLFENAYRYGGGGMTRITVTGTEDKTNLTLALEDNGIGISERDKSHIFEWGFGKNTGLGLFLVREILALTEITIRETGKPGHGARFEITIPQGIFRKRKTP